MLLDEYLFYNKISVKDFAAKIGYNRSWISSIISGKKKPSLRLAKTIEQATDGKVKVSGLINVKNTKVLK